MCIQKYIYIYVYVYTHEVYVSIKFLSYWYNKTRPIWPFDLNFQAAAQKEELANQEPYPEAAEKVVQFGGQQYGKGAG